MDMRRVREMMRGGCADPFVSARYYKKDQAAPDYQSLADASAEAARIGAELGQDQLDFAKQQYQDLAPFFKTISDQQMALSEKSAAQGDDYFNYMKSFRPVEQQMLGDAMQGRDGEISDFDAANRRDAATITADDATLYNQNRDKIENDVGTAIADAQGGYTRAVGQAMREGMRYGLAPANVTGRVGSLGLSQAQALAATANGTRRMGVQDVRNRAAMGLQLRQNNMGQLNQQRAIDWAKRLDAAGLVKGLPGASQGAYGLAINAGNSAGQNSMAAGNQYMAGMGQGSGTMMQGQNSRINGLSSLVSSQVSGQQEDQTGSIIGSIAGVAGAAMMMSDRRLKQHIVRIGTRADGLGVYAYRYVWGGGTQIGVMADEVRAVYPSAVVDLPSGYSAVDYAQL